MRDRPPYRLRGDLVIQQRVFAGEVKYVVKDPLRLEYFTIDQVSYTLLSLCDGVKDLARQAEIARKLFPGLGLDIWSLSGFYENYRTSHFFDDPWEKNILLMEKRRTSRAQAFRKATANILEIHIPAWNPDRFFGRIVKPLGFLFTRRALVVYALVFLSSVWIMMAHAGRFALPLNELYVIQGRALTGIVTLWFILLLSVLLHEIGHGLTCKHFGGGVYKIGVLLLYFNPCLFCDVTESYFFNNKAHKHAVTLAGGIVDLMVAAAATWYWFLTSPDLFSHQVAHRIAIFCGVSGLLINFNPLLKYDGYYLLSDHLEIPNLRGDAFRFLGGRIRRRLGLPHDAEVTTRRESRIFWTYGVLAILYSVFILWLVFSALSGWLVQSYRAAGYLVSAAILFLLTRKYLAGLLGFGRFAVRERWSHFRRRRWAYGLGGALLVAVLGLIPFPRGLERDCVLEPGQVEIVRARVGGIVSRVLAREGDRVAAGDAPVVIESDDVKTGLLEAAAYRRAAEAEKAGAEIRGDPGRAGGFQARVMAGQALEAHHERQSASAAPAVSLAGVVLTPFLDLKVGRAVAPGDTLFEIGDPGRLRAVVEIDEQWLGLIETSRPAEIRPLASPGTLCRARLESLSQEPAAEGRRKLYRATLVFDNPGGSLKPGMRGRVRLPAGRASLARQAFERMTRAIKIEFWV